MMNANVNSPKRWRLRFTSQGLFSLILAVALIAGWVTSLQRFRLTHKQMEQRLRYAEQELDRSRDELRAQARGKQPDRQRSFWEAELDGSDLSGMTISSGGNACQRASFRNCKLDNATLGGGAASFQLAKFDGANLTNASLTGGGASFQGASFVGANLLNATLSGGANSYQSASFEDAILIGAKLSGNFELANFSGAKLEQADLSAVGRDHLASCYFKLPPTYDAKTKFPAGFDPAEHQWRRVDEGTRPH